MVTSYEPARGMERLGSGDRQPPPRSPYETDERYGGPGDEKAWFMFYMQRGGRPEVISLAGVWFWTNFSREKLWRSFEDLEDLGYVERVEEDPRSALRKLLDSCKNPNDRLLATTFIHLTGAGLRSVELQVLISSMAANYPGTVSGVLHYIDSSARLLPERLKLELSQEWEKARRHENPARRRFSGLLLVMYACTALIIIALPVLAGIELSVG